MFLANFEELPLDDPLMIAILIVGGLIIIMTVISLITEIFLAVSYIKYNRRQNSLGMTGEEVARTVLDKNGLDNIRVSATGSFLFGNSYSHYFKKVRLRRFTYRKASITSLAMATQKSSLAVLDKEGDKDMKTRIVLTPITFFGPLAFIPIVLLGILLDFIVFNTNGVITIIALSFGVALIFAALFLQFYELKTEKKAQKKAIELMKNDKLATDEEIGMMKDLYRLYNIEYINNIILAILEIIWRILIIILQSRTSSSSSSSSK